MNDKNIDLKPHEWISETKRPREPFWGPDAVYWLPRFFGMGLFMAFMHYLRGF